MAEKFKIIPLGGLNEIGKNMTVYEYGGDIIVVDCGMAFPGDDMYGIDCVIPDVSYLVKNRSRLRGLFITHGHEDHIGAIPYVLKQINMPIYCTRFTAGLIKLKLQEHGLASSTKLITVEPGQTVRAGKFQVEFIHVNHSIADSVAFAIHTRMGAVVHTGDFKIDSTPIDGEVIDLARFGELGKQGVLALLADSTNVERPGYTMSERAVGATFKRQFTGCDKRIIVTTFASNVHRIQQVLDAAAACGRKVAVTGRSMENIMKVSTELGYMKVPKNTLMDINRIKNQIITVTVLQDLTIDAGNDAAVKSIYLVGDDWTHRTESIQTLSACPLPITPLHIARRNVVYAGEAKNIIHRILTGSLFASLTDDNTQFTLKVNSVDASRINDILVGVCDSVGAFAENKRMLGNLNI